MSAEAAPGEGAAAHIEVHVVSTQAQFEDYLRIRREVFVEEQAVPEDEEMDEHDGEGELRAVPSSTQHFLALCDGMPAATGRLVPSNGRAKIGRIATLSKWRGKGIASVLMRKIHEEAKGRGYSKAYLGAQVSAIPFYVKVGYRVRSEDTFLDAGIEHVWMDIDL